MSGVEVATTSAPSYHSPSRGDIITPTSQPDPLKPSTTGVHRTLLYCLTSRSSNTQEFFEPCYLQHSSVRLKMQSSKQWHQQHDEQLQTIMSRKQHHIHPWSAKKKRVEYKKDFPRVNEIMKKPTVICPSIYQKRDLPMVVAGILYRRGHILLAQRREGKPLAGLWEFPGGKVERNEAPEDALVRELKEELNITITNIAPLSWNPPMHDAINIRFWTCITWEGVPSGAEGQAVRWVHINDIDQYAKPSADECIINYLRTLPTEIVQLETTSQHISGTETSRDTENIFVVALVGGPGAGKSSTLAVLKNTLTYGGYQVLTIPENATHFFQNSEGFQPSWLETPALVAFQRLLLQFQLDHENAFLTLASLHPTKHQTIMLLDNCTLGGKAYVSEVEWAAILAAPARPPIREEDLWDRYNLLVHLTTSAQHDECAQWWENNPTRWHTPEEALAVDNKLRHMFGAHPGHRILPCYTHFADKAEQTLRVIQQAANFFFRRQQHQSRRLAQRTSTKKPKKQRHAHVTALSIPNMDIDMENGVQYINKKKDRRRKTHPPNDNTETTVTMTAPKDQRNPY